MIFHRRRYDDDDDDDNDDNRRDGVDGPALLHRAEGSLLAYVVVIISGSPWRQWGRQGEGDATMARAQTRRGRHDAATMGTGKARMRWGRWSLHRHARREK